MPAIPKPRKAVIMDATTRQFVRFQFNPEPTEETIQINYQEISAPGLAAPFFQYVSGAADEVSFDIYLNDRGEKRGFTADFIVFMYRFKPRPHTRLLAPPPIILSYGTFRRTGIVTSMRITREAFNTDNLQVKKATISLIIKSLPT